MSFDPKRYDFQMFALFLEARRIHRGVSVGTVARLAEVTPDAVARATAGRNPGEDEFIALAAWMGEPANRFLKAEAR